MLGIVGFEHLPIRCIIGVYPEERTSEQEIFVDVKVETCFAACVESDHLSHALDYDLLAKICVGLAKERHYQLLETFAHEVIEEILEKFSVNWVWVKVKKPMKSGSGSFKVVELKKEKQG